MKRMMQLLLTGLAGAVLVAGNALAKDRAERVTLGAGATATLKGEIRGHDSVQYTFTARAGHTVTIRLITSNPSNYINVERTGEAEALCQGALTGNACTVQVTSTEDLVVDVFLMRNAARRGAKAAYTLLIEQR